MIENTKDNPITLQRIKEFNDNTLFFVYKDNRLVWELIDAKVCIEFLLKRVKELGNENGM